ncbi:MAG TPA: cyclic nucleotide-binding domain-containing protein [Polyangiaceae bacterium]|nr:cyclic nucleotide-binding domain-containing protein [Polyangiaceae bacterium]
MPDARLLRVSRELFLAAFGMDQQSADLWVIDRLIGLLDEEDVQAGQRLNTAGEPLEFIYFMQNGAVRMTRDGAPPWTFQGRWVLGTFEAHLDRPLTRSATALSDFQAMKVRPSAWLELVEDSSLLARENVRFGAAAVAQLEQRIPGGLPKSSTEPTPTLPLRSSTVIERLAFLAEVEMLRGAGVQPLAELAVASQQVAFEPGAVLVELGTSPEQILVIVEGEVQAKRGDSEAIWHYGPRDIVCGPASFEGTAAREVRAASATRAISFPLEVWFELMDEHFDLVRAALSALGLRREALLDYLAEQSNGIVLT